MPADAVIQFQPSDWYYRPRLCKKSGRSLPVGRISILSPSYELEWEKTWASCSKHSRSYRLSPTDTNKHEFLHSLGHLRKFAPVNRAAFCAIAVLRCDMGEVEAENLRYGSAEEPFNWEISVD